MKTIETIEQAKDLRKELLEVVNRNFETALKSEREGDHSQATILRILTDTIKEDADALEQIIIAAGYIKETDSDIQWYLTRPNPHNFKEQIEEIEDYRFSALTRKFKLISKWNKEHDLKINDKL